MNSADSSMRDKGHGRVDWLIGLGVYGAVVAGIGGLAVSLVAFATRDFSGAGIGLVAAAIAFGALANALLRR